MMGGQWVTLKPGVRLQLPESLIEVALKDKVLVPTLYPEVTNSRETVFLTYDQGQSDWRPVIKEVVA